MKRCKSLYGDGLGLYTLGYTLGVRCLPSGQLPGRLFPSRSNPGGLGDGDCDTKCCPEVGATWLRAHNHGTYARCCVLQVAVRARIMTHMENARIGRPTLSKFGHVTTLSVSMTPELLAAIDTARSAERPIPPRTAAIRDLCATGLRLADALPRSVQAVLLETYEQKRGEGIIAWFARVEAYQAAAKHAAAEFQRESDASLPRASNDGPRPAELGSEVAMLVEEWLARWGEAWVPTSALYELSVELGVLEQTVSTDRGRRTRFGQLVLNAIRGQVIRGHLVETAGRGKRRRARLVKCALA